MNDAEHDNTDNGTAGASARREHARRRAAREQHARERHPQIGKLLLALTDEPQEIQAWERGARGEELAAAALTKHVTPEVTLLHDRRIPGRGNIDHIAIAPSGVWVIDTKRYRGRVSIQRRLIGRRRLMIAGRDQTKLIDGLERQVAAVNKALAGRRADGAGHERPVLHRRATAAAAVAAL